MLVVPYADIEKEKFKKKFARLDGSSFGLRITYPQVDKVRLSMSGTVYKKHSSMPLLYEIDCQRINNDVETVNLCNEIYLHSIYLEDCLFDVIFDTKGFIIIPQKYIFDGVVIKNKKPNTVDGYFSKVTFMSETKATSFVYPCNAFTNIVL